MPQGVPARPGALFEHTAVVLPLVFATLLHVIPLPSGLLTAQQESVSGLITDAYNGRILAGVWITVVGESRSTVSDRDGRFTLTGLSPSGAVIRLQHDGYVAEVHAVDVSGASSATIQFGLTPLATVISELKVAVPPEADRSELLGAGSRLQFHEAQLRAESGTVADFLHGGVTGLKIGRRSSAGGKTGSVVIRGSSSMLSNSPLIIVDGIRVEEMEVLDELPLSQVSSIEIVRGPEAMNFGLGGGHGVIIIRTGLGGR